MNKMHAVILNSQPAQTTDAVDEIAHTLPSARPPLTRPNLRHHPLTSDLKHNALSQAQITYEHSLDATRAIADLVRASNTPEFIEYHLNAINTSISLEHVIHLAQEGYLAPAALRAHDDSWEDFKTRWRILSKEDLPSDDWNLEVLFIAISQNVDHAIFEYVHQFVTNASLTALRTEGAWLRAHYADLLRLDAALTDIDLEALVFARTLANNITVPSMRALLDGLFANESVPPIHYQGFSIDPLATTPYCERLLISDITNAASNSVLYADMTKQILLRELFAGTTLSWYKLLDLARAELGYLEMTAEDVIDENRIVKVQLAYDGLSSDNSSVSNDFVVLPLSHRPLALGLDDAVITQYAGRLPPESIAFSRPEHTSYAHDQRRVVYPSHSYLEWSLADWQTLEVCHIHQLLMQIRAHDLPLPAMFSEQSIELLHNLCTMTRNDYLNTRSVQTLNAGGMWTIIEFSMLQMIAAQLQIRRNILTEQVITTPAKLNVMLGHANLVPTLVKTLMLDKPALRTDSLTFELWHAAPRSVALESGANWYVQVLFNGKVQRLPWCGGLKLCPWSTFSAYVLAYEPHDVRYECFYSPLLG